MQNDCCIGLVQSRSVVADINANLKAIEAFAHQAAVVGVNILCFPECCLQGYAPSLAQQLALPLDSRAVERCRILARDTGITLLIGLFEQGEHLKPYITQVAIFPEGQIGVYRKVHLGRSESLYLQGGTEFPVFESHGVKFGIGICWDWHFPELAAIYSLKGAEILFAPHASPLVSGDRREIWLRYLQARAYDNSVYLGACNLVGHNGQDKEFSGGTLILGPKGDIVAESFITEETMLHSVLSAERINTIRTRERSSMRDSFFLADRRKALYRELLELDIEL